MIATMSLSLSLSRRSPPLSLVADLSALNTLNLAHDGDVKIRVYTCPQQYEHTFIYILRLIIIVQLSLVKHVYKYSPNTSVGEHFFALWVLCHSCQWSYRAITLK